MSRQTAQHPRLLVGGHVRHDGAATIHVRRRTGIRQPGNGLRALLLHYTTSGELTHDWEQSVSYAAIAVTDVVPAAAAYALDAADKAQLLALARQAIATGLARQRLPTPAAESLSAVLAAPGAAFVSLHLDGDLRGCIGSIEAEAPLYRDVLRNARSAAFEDPRFLPLTAAELERVTKKLWTV